MILKRVCQNRHILATVSLHASCPLSPLVRGRLVVHLGRRLQQRVVRLYQVDLHGEALL